MSLLGEDYGPRPSLTLNPFILYYKNPSQLSVSMLSASLIRVNLNCLFSFIVLYLDVLICLFTPSQVFLILILSCKGSNEVMIHFDCTPFRYIPWGRLHCHSSMQITPNFVSMTILLRLMIPLQVLHGPLCPFL